MIVSIALTVLMLAALIGYWWSGLRAGRDAKQAQAEQIRAADEALTLMADMARRVKINRGDWLDERRDAREAATSERIASYKRKDA